MRVRLVNATARPLDTVVATARSCYAARIVTAEEVAGEGQPEARRRRLAGRRDRLARSVLEAGHLTTYQHTHFQFAIEGVSRLAVWAFLHAHPFYNSEQVSQRYVRVSPEAVHVPPALPGALRDRYLAAVKAAHAAYRELTELLEPAVEARLLDRFPAWRRPVHAARLERQRRRGAQEVARYVLPLATTAHLHHTVSALTWLRYRRLPWHPDCPEEVRALVNAMTAEVERWDPDLVRIAPESLPGEPDPPVAPAEPAGYRAEFDRRLGGRTTALLAGAEGARAAVAQAVRAATGTTAAQLPDEAAVRLALDPSRSPLLGDTLGLVTHHPVLRAALAARVTFATRLSHVADSQNQRHRTVPGARPALSATVDDEPDYVVPSLVAADDAALRAFREAMERAWEAYVRLRRRAPAPHLALYLLPNAVAVRIVETADLAALQHKLRMRLCWNAQEEIRRIAWEQATQLREADPLIGELMLPPCGLRRLAGTAPYCPEGERYCGVPVWRLPFEAQEPPRSG